MTKRLYPSNLIKQAQSVVNGWDQISPTPAFGALTVSSLAAEIKAAADLQAEVAAIEAHLADKRAERDVHHISLWNTTKRARNSIKGSFGDDSPQYKMVGGTRLSERKPPRRKSTE